MEKWINYIYSYVKRTTAISVNMGESQNCQAQIAE